jgi:hypothetical protein
VGLHGAARRREPSMYREQLKLDLGLTLLTAIANSLGLSLEGVKRSGGDENLISKSTFALYLGRGLSFSDPRWFRFEG